MRVVQQGTELGVQPPSEDGRVARAVKQDRGGQAFADPGGNQGGPRSAVSRGQAVHPLPPLGIRVPPNNRRGDERRKTKDGGRSMEMKVRGNWLSIQPNSPLHLDRVPRPVSDGR